MGKQENIVVHFLSRDDRFADLFNAVCFNGEQVIDDKALKPWNETYRTVVKDRTGMDVIRRERDISRVVTFGDTKLLLMVCCVEHQEHINYCMPFRSMMYDCLEYSDQVSRIQYQHTQRKDLSGDAYLGRFAKEDKLIPVITLIFYTGDDKWDAGRCLWDMLDIGFPDLVRPYIGNWPLNLVEFQNMGDTEGYRSDLKLVLDILKHRDSKDDLWNFINQNVQYRNLEADTYMMISKFMKMDLIVDSENYENEEGGIDMCKAVQEIFEEGQMNGKIAGREEGREEGIRLAKRIFERRSAGEDIEEIAKGEGLDIEYVRSILL